MLYYHLLFFGLFSFVATSANAQVGQPGVDPSQFGNVHVHVVYTNDRSASLHLRVRLMSGSGSTPVSENFTNDQGRTEFTRVLVGSYHVVVTGEGIEEADSGVFEVDRRKISQDLFITVRRTNEANSNQMGPGSPSVAAVDLNVPDSARKEFEKANEDMDRHDWTSALQRLNRAISAYPHYALAYNNLAAVYGHMNDPPHEREALEKAIELNDHLVPALVNLAKLCFQDGNSTRAETLLGDASRAEPNNAATMTLLAQAQLLNKHFDAAIATARSVHTMPHQNFGLVHYIAARVLERESRLQDALAELQVFLTEEPKGARADHVREEVGKIQHAQR
jgi:tetratricopeptide (TPR) repeat protein